MSMEGALQDVHGRCPASIRVTKCEVPMYDGSRDPEVLDSWIRDMNIWFDYDEIIMDEKKAQYAKLKLTGLAQLLVADHVPIIEKWKDLVTALRLAFYPSTYEEDTKMKWLRLSQGFNMPVKEYIHQFNRLRILQKISENDKELVPKFKSGLQEHLYRELRFMKIDKLDEAYSYAQWAEEKCLDQCRIQQQYCSKKITLMAQSPIDVSGEDIVYEELKGELNKVTLLQQSTPDNTARDNLFITRAHLSHNFSTACILDNGSQGNLISKSIVNQLHLPVNPHPHPYALGWKDHGSSSQITHTCTVSFAFGPKFVDRVTCDVTDMDCCGLLLGRPYQYDRKAQYDAFNNTYLLHKDHNEYLIRSTLNLPHQASPQKRCLTFIQQPYPHHYPDLQHQVPPITAKVFATETSYLADLIRSSSLDFSASDATTFPSLLKAAEFNASIVGKNDRDASSGSIVGKNAK